MNESRLAAKVGLFVFLGIALVLLLLFSFSKGWNFLTPTYDLRLQARSVGGLKGRAAVLLSGVPVGNVVSADVDPEGKGVIIKLVVQAKYQIRSDARFVIDQFGFLGDQFVAVFPQSTNAPVLQPGSLVMGEEPLNLQEVTRSATGLIQRMDETVKLLNTAFTRVDRTVLHENTLTNITAALGNFRILSDKAVTMVDGVNRLVDTNSPPISISVSNMVRFSQELNQIALELQQTFSTNRVELTSVIKNLGSTTRVLDDLIKDVELGKGLAGSLIKDEQLRLHLGNILENLDEATSNINKYGLLYKPKRPKTSAVVRPEYPGKNSVK